MEVLVKLVLTDVGNGSPSFGTFNTDSLLPDNSARPESVLKRLVNREL